jgi:hypothetical protein
MFTSKLNSRKFWIAIMVIVLAIVAGCTHVVSWGFLCPVIQWIAATYLVSQGAVDAFDKLTPIFSKGVNWTALTGTLMESDPIPGATISKPITEDVTMTQAEGDAPQDAAPQATPTKQSMISLIENAVIGVDLAQINSPIDAIPIIAKAVGDALQQSGKPIPAKLGTIIADVGANFNIAGMMTAKDFLPLVTQVLGTILADTL